MTPAEVQSQLKSARAQLERVCTLLESPGPATLDCCAATMERVIGELDAGRRWMALAGEASAVEARRLRSVLHRARALLDLAADYHLRWRLILAGMSGGYTARGAPAALQSQARVSIQG